MFYWDKISEIIGLVLKRKFDCQMSRYEMGFEEYGCGITDREVIGDGAP